MSQRGLHGDDATLFSQENEATLRQAVGDFSWLLSRGYVEKSIEKIVGDRYCLRKRQREAVRRSSCSDEARVKRAANTLAPQSIRGTSLAIDGFNCLITLEAALAGGVLFVGQDGRLRDLASVHGSYRTVDNSEHAILLFCNALTTLAPCQIGVLLDAPVSNSGKLRGLLLAFLEAHLRIPFEVSLVPDPDQDLIARHDVVVSNDAWILDNSAQTFDLANFIVQSIDDVKILKLAQGC